MERTLLWMCVATTLACGARPTPVPNAYPYCEASYTALDADDVTPFGYSAQDLLDLHGLEFSGSVTWEVYDDPGYPVPLPPGSSVDVTLSAREIRWGTYTLVEDRSMTTSACPGEGLEIFVEGTAVLPGLDLDLSIEGHMLAPTDRDDDPPAPEDLSYKIVRELRGRDLDPFRPSIEAIAEAEDIAYKRIDPVMGMRLGGSFPGLSFDVVWYTADSAIFGGIPFNGELVLGSE